MNDANDVLRHSGMTPVPIICPYCKQESMTDFVVWFPTDCPHCKGIASDEVKARAQAEQDAAEAAAMKRLAATGDARTAEQVRRAELEMAQAAHKAEQQKWLNHVLKIYHEESTQGEKWFYLSFAGPEGFRGGLFIQAPGVTHTILRAHSLGINPGGEVASLELTDEQMATVPDGLRGRLLTRQEVESIVGRTQ